MLLFSLLPRDHLNKLPESTRKACSLSSFNGRLAKFDASDLLVIYRRCLFVITVAVSVRTGLAAHRHESQFYILF